MASIFDVMYVDHDKVDEKAYKAFAIAHYKAAMKSLENMKLSSGERLKDNKKFIEETEGSLQGLSDIDNDDSRGVLMPCIENIDACVKKCANLNGAKRIDIDLADPDIEKAFNYWNDKKSSNFCMNYKKLSDGSAVIISIGTIRKHCTDGFIIEYFHVNGDFGLVKELVKHEATIFDECVFI